MRFTLRTTLCGLATLFGLHLAGCKSGSQAPDAAPVSAQKSDPADPFPAGPYADRDPTLAKQLVDADALLLDVRSADEFAGGHIDGAVNIDHTQVAGRTDEISKLQDGDLHRPIVVYCASGRRSGLAKRALEAAGFDRVTNLGGIGDWPG